MNTLKLKKKRVLRIRIQTGNGDEAWVRAAVHSCAHPRLVVNDDEAWVCATVHPVVFEASYAASTM